MKWNWILLLAVAGTLVAQPAMVDERLGVRPVVSGLTLPTAVAFLGPNDMLVLEKNSGMVKRVVDGAVQGTVLDLAVNNASERGLLGVAASRLSGQPGCVSLLDLLLGAAARGLAVLPHRA